MNAKTFSQYFHFIAGIKTKWSRCINPFLFSCIKLKDLGDANPCS